MVTSLVQTSNQLSGSLSRSKKVLLGKKKWVITLLEDFGWWFNYNLSITWATSRKRWCSKDRSATREGKISLGIAMFLRKSSTIAVLLPEFRTPLLWFRPSSRKADPTNRATVIEVWRWKLLISISSILWRKRFTVRYLQLNATQQKYLTSMPGHCRFRSTISRNEALTNPSRSLPQCPRDDRCVSSTLEL